LLDYHPGEILDGGLVAIGASRREKGRAMGSNYSAVLIESVEDGALGFESAILIHLQSNCYPPVPSSMVGPCLEAIRIVQDAQYGDGDASDRVTLPDGVSWRGEEDAPAYAIVEGFHLDSFIQWEEI
jgi:hypothetical protein